MLMLRRSQIGEHKALRKEQDKQLTSRENERQGDRDT